MPRTKSYLSRKQDAYRRQRANRESKMRLAAQLASKPVARIVHEVRPVGSSLFSVATMFGPYCHICGLCCDFRSTGFNRRIAVTRDHLIPVSKGGRGGENLRPAHSYCNAKRGVDDITTELSAKCRQWIIKNVGAGVIEDVESWFNAHVRPALMFPVKGVSAIEDYRQASLAERARREDLFWKCCQGGLCSGR